jgi:tryptophanyl-tRNA synthetase
MAKPRLLTGDTPTGKLHLGHYVGSLENRVNLQKKYDCYFLLANYHAFTTKPGGGKEIHDSTLEIVLDYLAVGIDPSKSTIVLESEVPAILELTTLFSMLISFPRLMRNPTIKDEIRDKKLGDQYSVGFLWYPIIQVADILTFRGECVPVGEDQIPHLELTREVARRFNQLYCGVDPHAQDSDHLKAGGFFPIPEALIGRVKRLVGVGGPDANGRLLKMSKSLNNAIYLSDSSDTLHQKVMQLYTDPNRIRATDPGTVENNPLWIFHDAFNPDTKWIEEAKEHYRSGTIGDVECKKKLVEVLEAVLSPMRERRERYASDPGECINILKSGKEKANELAEETLRKVKEAIHQKYW